MFYYIIYFHWDISLFDRFFGDKYAKNSKNFQFFSYFLPTRPLEKKIKNFYFLVDIQYISSICTKF